MNHISHSQKPKEVRSENFRWKVGQAWNPALAKKIFMFIFCKLYGRLTPNSPNSQHLNIPLGNF